MRARPYLSIVISVYTDSGYTTKSERGNSKRQR
jgi:hypothetical protein